ncbi:MAG: hypothetical protein WA021_01140 [Minisyncoccia bacterium]
MDINAKVRYLRFVKFLSSWQVFVALIVPFLGIDYFFFDGNGTFFFWFIILYGFFILPLSISFYRRGGKERLAALESGDARAITKLERQDSIRYLAILAVLVPVLLYGMWKALL